MTEKPQLPSAPLSDISIGEIKYLLRKLDLSKETNCEDFSAWVSKEACENLCSPLAFIIICMRQTNPYPKLWKEAEFRPLKNVKNPSKLSNYRPISLLVNTAKITE